MASNDNDNEWVYLDYSDDEMALPKAASAMPAPAASGDATDACSGGAVDERGCNNCYADNTDEEDASSEDNYSVYSNEGRLERAYESDEELQLGCNSYGDESTDDEEDACSDDEDYYSDNYSSNEGLLEGEEKASPEAASAMPAYEVVTAADTACSGAAVGERGCYKESNEDLDQVDEETDHAASDMKKLLGKLLGDESGHAAFDFDMRKLLDKLLDVEFDYSAFDFDMRKMLDRLRCIADRRKATRNKMYRGGAYGGYSDYRYGGGGGNGVDTSNDYRGPSGCYYSGISDFDNGHLSDFDYGGGRDDVGLSDFDYGSGRCYHDNGRGKSGYYGGLSGFDYGGGGYYGGLSDVGYGSGRGYYGGLSDFDYGSGRGYYGGLSDFEYGSSGRGYCGSHSEFDYNSGGRAGYRPEGYGPADSTHGCTGLATCPRTLVPHLCLLRRTWDHGYKCEEAWCLLIAVDELGTCWR